jgi:signal transduction histidine kinase
MLLFCIPFLVHASSIALSLEEKAYLKNKQEIRLCLQPELFPFDGYENGEHTGVFGDIYQRIRDTLGVKFRYVVPQSQDELNRLVAADACDVISVIAKNQRRFKNIRATDAYFSETYFTIITKNDKVFTYTPKSLEGKVLLTRFDSFKDYLSYLYPYLTIKIVTDQDQAMTMLLNDDVYGVIAINELADFIIQKYGYKMLHINGVLAREHPIEGAIGVLESETLLLTILNKILRQTDRVFYEDIKAKWRISRFIDKTDYTLLLNVVGVVVLLLFIFIYWNKKLQEEIKRRIYAESQLQELNQTLGNRVLEGINEIHHREKLLLAQSRSAQMGEMISMIAHQWRQPLTAINAAIIGMQTKISLGKFHLETSRERDVFITYLNEKFMQISGYVEFLSMTVDDFRYFYKKEKEKKLVCLNEPVNNALKIIKGSLEANKIDVHINFETSDQIMLFPNELTQVILNLLKNAEDNFLEHKIQNPCIEIKTKKDDNNYLIEICDNGWGIPSEILPHIFDPYFSTKLEKNGTGLGLYMSKLIIEEHHHGMLNVNNQFNGVCFEIILKKG